MSAFAQRGRSGWAAVGVVIATIAAYHNCWHGDFVFDDQSTILENASIRQLWPLGPVLNPPADAGICGRPFANLTMAVNYAINGLDIRGYRAVNLTIHLLTALTLFGVVRRTLLLPSMRDRFARDADWVGAAVAGLWSLHPLTTIVVNYISQRVEGLMALFYLLALYGFIRSTENTSRRWGVFAFVACLLGMASKEVMATAPVMIFLYDRTFVAGGFRTAWRARWRLHLALASTWLALAWFMSQAQLAHRGIGFSLGVSSFDYALSECRAVLLYLKLAVWPHPLVFDYGWAFATSMRDTLPAVVGIAALVTATLLALWRRPVLGFAGAWFLGVLAPSSSIVPLIQQPIAESRVYLPLAAIVGFGAVGLYRFAGRRSAWALGALALGFGFLTIQRNSVYHDELQLWSDTVARRPQSARAHASLGAALLRAGRIPDAVAHLEKALRLKPAYADAENNLGVALLRSGQIVEATAHYRAALAAHPDFADAHCNLGEANLLSGNILAAVENFSTAIRLQPDHAKAQNNLGVALLQAGKTAEAILHGETAVRLDPHLPEAHYNLGNALARANRAAEAIAQFQAALRLDPGFAKAHNNLGVMLLRDGRAPAAIAHFEAALRINPNYVEARRNLEQAQQR
jgi:tetratricopeptide (TPR) repeat protein